MAASLVELLSAESLLDQAGASAFARGSEYESRGKVLEIKSIGDDIRAIVKGNESYRVRIWLASDGLCHECTCPAALDGAMCKHVVATGLTWIRRMAGGERESASQLTPRDEYELMKQHLGSIDKQELIKMLLDHAASDDRLDRRLRSLLARTDRTGPDVRELRRLIDRATATRDFVDYRSAPSFVAGIDDAVDAIGELISDGHAVAAIELATHAIERIERAFESVDDSDGGMGTALKRAQDVHLEACRAARPEPRALAKQLFAKEISSSWETFHRAAFAYRDVLGAEGLDEYRKLIQPLWNELPRLQPSNERDSDDFCHRFRLSSIMEAIADAHEDLSSWIEIVSHDLSCPHRFQLIAERCQRVGRLDLATEWATRGLNAFPTADSRLRLLLAAIHRANGRPDEGMALLWSEFVDHPGLATYRILRDASLEHWPTWRTKAMDHTRSLSSQLPTPREHRWGMPRRSTIHDEWICILLFEGEVDAAWDEANKRECGFSLMLDIARKRAKAHPSDAIPIYERHVEELLDGRKNSSYSAATEVLRELQGLATRTSTIERFAKYLERVRATHKAKRNFIKLLNERQWN